MAGIATTFSSTPTQTTDALFRAWGSTFAAQFAACGWVQTADTGQINWTTVLTPGAANTSQGYEIWRLADTLQATAPIFLKWEYGSGTAAGNPAFWFTFGTGSNGAGTLTGPISTRTQTVSSSYATNALTSYVSGDTNRIHIAWNAQGTGISASIANFVSIERTKDAAGADTNQGIFIIYKNQSTGTLAQYFWDRTLGTTTPNPESTLGSMGNSGSTGKSGTQVAVYPIFPCSAGIFLNPIMGALPFYAADIVAFGAVTFTIYGALHTYMPFSSTTYTGSALLSRASGTMAMLMRYET